MNRTAAGARIKKTAEAPDIRSRRSANTVPASGRSYGSFASRAFASAPSRGSPASSPSSVLACGTFVRS